MPARVCWFCGWGNPPGRTICGFCNHRLDEAD